MKMKTLSLMAGVATAMFVASANAGVTGIECRLYENADWDANGYDSSAMDTYRIYMLFDNDSTQLNAVFGNGDNPLTINSDSGAFINSALFNSLTAPLDLTGIGVWANQWDTYVTIDTTMNTGDATGLTPGFDGQVGSLNGNVSMTNGSWFVTPDDAPQGNADGGEVMVAQITVGQDEGLWGTMHAQIAGGAQTLNLEFNCIPAPGALALLGLAGLAGTRRRRG